MQNRIVKLPGVRACALYDLLQALIDEIGRRSGSHRPLVYSLTARKATGPFVHPGVDLHDGQLYLLLLTLAAGPIGGPGTSIGAGTPG